MPRTYLGFFKNHGAIDFDWDSAIPSSTNEPLDPTAILGALEPIVESEMSRWDAILFNNKTPSWFKGVAYYGGIDGSIAALLRRWQIKGAEA